MIARSVTLKICRKCSVNPEDHCLSMSVSVKTVCEDYPRIVCASGLWSAECWRVIQNLWKFFLAARLKLWSLHVLSDLKPSNDDLHVLTKTKHANHYSGHPQQFSPWNVVTLIVFLPCHSACHFNMYKRSFVLRSLFNDAYKNNCKQHFSFFPVLSFFSVNLFITLTRNFCNLSRCCNFLFISQWRLTVEK